MSAFRVNRKAPYPWTRAISSGLSAGIPILVGIALGHFTYGLMAVMGGFAYLYTRAEQPYPRRAVTLLFVMLGLAVCFGVGSLSGAASPWVAAVVLGLVGAAAVFLCEALDVPPPSALFFIFTCAAGTSMAAPNLSGTLVRAALIFLGGIPAWLIAMAGWIVDPHEPETMAVSDAYRALASWLAAVGTERVLAAQHDAAVALRTAEQALSGAAIRWRRPDAYTRLMRLNQQADAVFLAIIELGAAATEPVDVKLTAAVRALADAVADPDRAACLIIPKPAGDGAPVEHLYRELSAAVAIAADEQPEPVETVAVRRGSVRTALAGAFDRKSLIVPKSLRFGAVLIIAYLVAYAWRTERPYWVFLSAAAVMLGPTATATLNRAVQRLVGTAAGAVLSAIMLALRPSGLLIALTVMVLQVLAQLMLVRNYALTVALITPLGLLIAHFGHPELTTHTLVTARLVDILLGGVLGLAGTMLFWGRSASQMLPVLLSDALRTEARLLQSLLADRGKPEEAARHHLQTSLLNLRMIYDTAANELAGDMAEVEALWPAVIAVQRLGYFLIAVTDRDRRARIPRETLAQLEGVFDALACAVEEGCRPKVPVTPVIPEYPVISQELHEISHGLQVLHGSP